MFVGDEAALGAEIARIDFGREKGRAIDRAQIGIGLVRRIAPEMVVNGAAAPEIAVDPALRKA